MSFTCPQCGATSYNPNDAVYEYCGNCHEFIRRLDYGKERYSSGSSQAQPDRTMQVCEDSEQGEAELSQMQRDGEDNRLRSVRGNGMERNNEQEMREMRGDGMHLTPEYKPSMYRFYIGAIAVGIATGMAWTEALQRFMTPRHTERMIFSIVAAIMAWQFLHLWSEHKRMKILEAAIRKDWDNLKATYPNAVNLEQYKVVEKRWGKR